MGKYQPFTDLPAAQFQALVDDVARRGVLLPIIVDENDATIDGHQRRRAAAEAAVDCPRIVVAGLTEAEKHELAITLNLFRRHLVGVERSQALQKLANLGLSVRRIGEALNMSKSAVHRDLTQLSHAGQLERPERVEGADGKSRPATMPRRVDPETGEITEPSGAEVEQEGGTDEQSTSKVPTSAPVSTPESKAERDAREKEQRRRDRNEDFGKFLVGIWAMFNSDRSAGLFLDGWVPEECPMWLVPAHQPIFSADGIRDVAARLEKLATEWESRV